MSEIGKRAMNIMNMLPESEQIFALEFLRKLVKAWDPDFTRLTEIEEKELVTSMKEIEAGEFVSHEEIDW